MKPTKTFGRMPQFHILRRCCWKFNLPIAVYKILFQIPQLYFKLTAWYQQLLPELEVKIKFFFHQFIIRKKTRISNLTASTDKENRANKMVFYGFLFGGTGNKCWTRKNKSTCITKVNFHWKWNQNANVPMLRKRVL